MEQKFGTLLKEVRRSKQVSQRELAERVGVDFSYISKIENNRLAPPAADTIVKICEALDVPSEVLLAHSGKVSSEIKDAITASPAAVRFMNQIQEMKLTDDEWGKLSANLKKLR